MDPSIRGDVDRSLLEKNVTIFIGIIAFFVILGVLILVHEVGHFAFAKLMGVRVDEFGLGFPPRLKTWRRGGTVYSLNAIPLGGFVKMLGENGDHPEPDSFGAKPPWQRFLILVAGPGMNLLLALAIFFGTFMIGSPRYLTVVTSVVGGSPAATAGLHVGDRIVAVDGQPVKYADQLQGLVLNNLGERLTIRVERGSKTFSTGLVPRVNPPPHQGPMGVGVAKSMTVAYGPADSLGRAFGQIGAMVGSLPLVLQSIGQHGGGQVAGPIGIAQGTTDVVQNEPSTGIGTLLQWVALLSANLGVLNLLPIPALDGGRLVFVLLSWVRRRNLDPELEGLVHMVGMAMLLMLILVISYQDVARWVGGGSF